MLEHFPAGLKLVLRKEEIIKRSKPTPVNYESSEWTLRTERKYLKRNKCIWGIRWNSNGSSFIEGGEPHFSYKFSRIVVELEKELYPTKKIIEWKRKDRKNSSVEFEVLCSGSPKFTTNIYLFIDNNPTLYLLSEKLNFFIGT